jgi:hypothetical protein
MFRSIIEQNFNLNSFKDYFFSKNNQLEIPKLNEGIKSEAN